MDVSFAYLSQGKLNLKLAGQPLRIVDSRFGEKVRQRAMEIQERNAWKTQGRGAQFMTGGMLWGQQNRGDASMMRIAISGISRGCNDGELLYALDTDEIGGIFALRNYGADEQRLFHSADYRVRQLNASPNQDRIACVMLQKNGGSCIAVMRGDGTEIAEATQGDTIDQAPRWLPGSNRELVFLSAGIGRDPAGNPAGQSAFSVQKLNLDAGEVTTLAEDANADLLGPQMSADGSLYFIRRPYQDPRKGPGFFRSLFDLVLLPFRLLFALFQYLNFFTMIYTGKTLTSQGGARSREQNPLQMMIYGNLVKAQKAGQARDDETPSLVPNTWELVCQKKDSAREVIAKGVLSFDLCPDGSVLYSNGSAVFHRDAQGRTERLAKDAMIEQVVAV